MNVEYLVEYLDYTVDAGINLNTEQQLCIQNSLRVLQDQGRFQGVYFWGIIKGTRKDYYIAFGVREDALDRTFYYSMNLFSWVLLPNPLSQDNAPALSLQCRTRFVGDPMVMKAVPDSETVGLIGTGAGDPRQPEEAPGSDLGEEFHEPSLRDLKEEDRLAVVVKDITDEAFVLPRRALFKVPNKIGSVVFNAFFRGLNDVEALRLQNFVHYREPRNKWNLNLLETSAANYSCDFLDTVSEDIPKHRSFNLIRSYDGMIVHSKSLLWHGASFFHVIDTPRYGNIYFGYGIKNFDVPFMLSPMIM